MVKQQKLEHLRCTFPKLTETNQHYVLGLAEGLKQAQGNVRNISVGKVSDVYIENKLSYSNITQKKEYRV